ncbi:asparagine synthase [Microdochium trichocladiopsis]|uniref:Asparagine synthase n=1 Tax=Microdochium trichocladiopsis TaxID=1682393 RepID=A0A9P8YGA9_9PEZI|nr:asparagine synthase [Microdochium trichocladiopsis]KAH7039755.1 asparagine synthase [Microdochium trichocladiopsis]
MCGIHAVISVNGTASPDLGGALKQSLQNRGPDHLGQACRTLQATAAGNTESQALHLTFTSTVLALRGDHIAQQPLLGPSADGSVLCWNGEAWRFDGQPVSGNDGEALCSRLSQPHPDTPRQDHVLGIFRSIQGPFAVVYYDDIDRRVYYGRDRLGRRSLLVHRADDGSAISFSSVAGQPVTGWTEVPADGLYSLNLDACTGTLVDYTRLVERHMWLDEEPEMNMVSNVGLFNATAEKPDGNDCQLQAQEEGSIVDDLESQLMSSLKLRVVDVPEPPRAHAAADRDVRVAILFSGGLDCTVLARLAHELVPTSQGLDLINVAFENPRLVAQYLKQPEEARKMDFYETCPDRITARKAFAELKQSCPGRSWRLITVNIPFEETMAHKPTVVSLIHPHDTEMDLSIAIALYFAARGTGHAYTASHVWQPSMPLTTTPARVLLSGLGADELFGGYARHDIAYKRAGYEGLVEELRLDVGRIGQRNLGRDDRAMSHWGKEVRFPFLDEELVRFAIGLPVWAKCDFGIAEHETGIEPAKRILRLLADRKGLPIAAREKKRAVSS